MPIHNLLPFQMPCAGVRHEHRRQYRPQAQAGCPISANCRPSMCAPDPYHGRHQIRIGIDVLLLDDGRVAEKDAEPRPVNLQLLLLGVPLVNSVRSWRPARYSSVSRTPSISSIGSSRIRSAIQITWSRSSSAIWRSTRRT